MTKILKINNTELLKSVETNYFKFDLPKTSVGDTVRLGIEIKEGDKVRVQAYEGVIISKKNRT